MSRALPTATRKVVAAIVRFAGCVDSRAFRTEHCHALQAEEFECIALNANCEYFEQLEAFFDGAGSAPESVCPALNDEKSICLVEHEDEINGADDD